MRFQRVSGLLVLLAVVGCASVPDSPIEVMLRSAETPADHQRIAAYYREQAAEIRSKSVEHRRLADLYGGLVMRGTAFARRQSDHCEEILTSEGRTATLFEKLAAEHDRLARE